MTVFRPYPKIPRFDHDSVNQDLYSTSDLVLLEKYDGSNLKFTAYDERYHSSYPDQITDLNPDHGEIVFGGRRSVRGIVDHPFNRFDGNFQRALNSLDEIPSEPLLSLHDEIGPITLYAENMVYHSLDYGYVDDPPPPVIGFDVYAARDDPREDFPSDPYDDDFRGFLTHDRVEDIFDRLGLPTANRLDISPPIDPSSLSIPQSELADVQAEGVVFRSDSLSERAKKVSAAHQEVNRRIFGGDPTNAESGAEYLVEKYCTPARIRKQVARMVEEEDREFGLHLNEELYERVVVDIWREEWREIMKLDRSITPSEVYPLVADRCIEQLRQMKTNAQLNETSPLKLWRSTWDSDTEVGAGDEN